MDLEAFELVLLRRPSGAPDYPREELERIQDAFYRTGSLKRSMQLAEADPAVLAGRPAVEVMTW